MVTEKGLKNRITRIKKEYGRLKPMVYYEDVVLPARRTEKSMAKQEKQAKAIISKQKAIRKKIYEESGYKPRAHKDFKKYQEAKEIISLAELWFY